MTVFVNNIQNNTEDENRSSWEIFRVDKVDGVPNETDNIATFSEIRLEGAFVSKNVLNVPRGNHSSAGVSLISKELDFFSYYKQNRTSKI